MSDQYASKAAIKSLGVTAPVVAIAIIVAKTQGVDLTPEFEGLPHAIAAVIDQGDAIVAILLGAYGRIRATSLITGLLKAK